MSNHLKDEFWDRMDDVRAGMLGTKSARSVPMSHYVDRDEKVLWFISANGTDLAKAAHGGEAAEYVVADMGNNIFARIDGHLTAVTDREKLDELWSAMAAAWFEDGKQDDDIQLLKMDLSQAEIWATDGGLSFLYEIAKANMTGDKPETGDHGTVVFKAA